MLSSYSRGQEDNITLKSMVNWKNVSSVILSQERVLNNLELEQIKQDVKFWSPGITAGLISKLFPKRKIEVVEKLIWVLKIDGVTIVESEVYDSIIVDYNYYTKQWQENMNKN